MAISGTHYQILKQHQHLLPRGGSLLEIGEANWYGDVLPDFPFPKSQDPFAVAKACYAHLFAPSIIQSIDAGGTSAAMKQDLNEPLELFQQFDVVINHGTAEHVFNIGQVFRSMHDAAKAGGLLIHESPFTGWVDHGFYCLQPTLFYDVAAANCYQIVSVSIEHIDSGTIIRLESREHVAQLAQAGKLPNNAMLFVVLRKTSDDPFRVPMQGYYARTLSEAGQKAWRELR
jgi:hypothetical protein